jgi:hypothetical protein
VVLQQSKGHQDFYCEDVKQACFKSHIRHILDHFELHTWINKALIAD